MNLQWIGGQYTFGMTLWVAVAVMMIGGCKDLTPSQDAPSLDSITGTASTSDSEPAPDIGTSATESAPGANGESDPGRSEPEDVAVAAGGASADGPAVRPQPTPTTSDDGSESPPEPKPATAPKPNGPPPAAASRVASTQLVPKRTVAIRAVKPDTVYEPRVVMSRGHEQTCLVGVGDAMPDLKLTRSNGEPVTMGELQGEALTVVVFWTNRFAFAREQFARLAEEVALPYQHLGLKVIAVNVGDPVEQIEPDAMTRESVVCVHDRDGAAVAQVAESKLPRTYLLDRDGRILWFDIEYSRTTRRQLRNAIFYHCREDAGGDAAEQSEPR